MGDLVHLMINPLLQVSFSSVEAPHTHFHHLLGVLEVVAGFVNAHNRRFMISNFLVQRQGLVVQLAILLYSGVVQLTVQLATELHGLIENASGVVPELAQCL